MAKRRIFIEKEQTESSFELDLAPMLALMVTLIPIMLLATSFLKVTVIETPLPQAVKNAIEEDSKKKKREVVLTLDINDGKQFSLNINNSGREQRISIPQVNGEFDFSGLHQKLVEVKQKHPAIFRLNLRPAEAVPYSEIVKVMDEARTIKDRSKKVRIMDKKSQKEILTDVMFPNVVFSNVVEG